MENVGFEFLVAPELKGGYVGLVESIRRSVGLLSLGSVPTVCMYLMLG